MRITREGESNVKRIETPQIDILGPITKNEKASSKINSKENTSKDSLLDSE